MWTLFFIAMALGTGIQACTDITKLLTCAKTYADAVKGWTSQNVDTTLFCKVINGFKTCYTDACGSGSMTQQYVDLIDAELKQYNIRCDAGCLVSSLFLTLLLFLAARVFTEK
ncbi:hypothetical protein ACOMHN_041332 [Nucella lapillus]